MPAQPNVLFIISDQHNAKCLGHKGHPDVKTPNLDRLAAAGTRFDNAICQNPICTPSRVCYLSGQYCHNHGYYGLSGRNPGGLPSVLGHFRRAGYRTAAMGKIHCPEYWIEDDADVFHETCGCSVAGRSPAYAKFLEDCGKTDLEDHGAMNEFGRRGLQTCDARASKVTFFESQEGWISREIIAFMGACQAEDRPFFAHVSLPKPHQCYTPAQEFWDLYDEDTLTLPGNADYEMTHKAPNLRRAAENWRNGKWTLFEPHGFAAGRRRKLRGYLGNISQVDKAVGDIVDWLDQSGMADNTIVIYGADHGDYAAEHDIMEKAPGISSDAITRVPFIWRWPGQFPAGRVVPELVETVDLATTVCGLCGLANLETSDGKDLGPLLRGGSGEVRKVAVTEFAWSKSVRKGNYRFIYYPPEMFAEDYPEGFGELYDLAADPWEMTNLYFDPAHAAKVAELRADLLEWLVTTTRPATVLPGWGETTDQRVLRYKNACNHDGKISPERIRQLRGGNYI